jgi:hypothetical protein
MNGTLQYMAISGNMLELGSTGSQAVSLVLLCGIANGSAVVPVAVSGNGCLMISS